MSQDIQKVVLHNILLKIRAEILHLFVFMIVVAAILNLTSRSHQRSSSFRLRWITSHNILLKRRAEILRLFVFMVVLAATLNLTSRGDQRSSSFRLRWILNIRCPQLTPCQISKTCHQVQDCSEFPPRYNLYFHSYLNNTDQLHNCSTNFRFVTMKTYVRGECFC